MVPLQLLHAARSKVIRRNVSLYHSLYQIACRIALRSVGGAGPCVAERSRSDQVDDWISSVAENQ